MDGRNIGDVDVLVDVAAAVGLRDADVRQVLDERRFKDAVDADWTLSNRMGVTGVPTFVAGSRQVVGAQPETVLRELLNAAGAVPRRSADTGP